ncbi:hypothetical protein FALB51S_00452 [Frigidibacter albus]|uniref:Peptidase U7 n=1 Tax=Frigidibacter mobilis TaxID=1335048 RepID=A0A159Z706_9RHOB|nr:peptidase U7 [Frigidibacter mobilis]
MHHAQIAQRAFNTPLMVDPAKALAFLSGLGPRITGQDITFAGLEVEAADQVAAALPCPPARRCSAMTLPSAISGAAASPSP